MSDEYNWTPEAIEAAKEHVIRSAGLGSIRAKAILDPIKVKPIKVDPVQEITRQACQVLGTWYERDQNLLHNFMRQAYELGRKDRDNG